jgi:TonB family protein
MTSELSLYNLGLYSIQIAILSLVAALAVWAFGLRAPRAQLAFWYAVLACCVFLPAVEPWYQPPMEAAARVTFSTRGFVPLDSDSTRGWVFSWGLGWAGTALVVLGAGAAVRLVLLGFGMLKLRRLRRSAEPVPRLASVERASAATLVSADFLCSEDITGPVTFGFRNPVILVPPGFYDLRESEQESIAIHELLHVRRRDWLWTLAEEFVRALLWFHPAIWFLLNRVQLAREQTVDEAVVESTRQAGDYVGALLKIAAARIEPDLAPAPLFLRKRHLRERVAAIVKGATMSKSRLTLTMIAVLSVLPIAAGVLAWQIPLHAAPQEVRDADGVEARTGAFKLLHRDAVAYPAEARKKGVSGEVIASLSVNAQGEVTDARIVSGPDELRRAVLQSVLGWHFASDAQNLPPAIEVAVRFTSPGPVADTPATHKQGGGKTFTLDRIDTSLLPQALRDKVEQAMPVRTGDLIGYDKFPEIERSLQAIDSHIRVYGSIKEDKASVHVTLAGTSGLHPATTIAPDAQRIRVGGNKQALNLVSKVTPVYPAEAKQAGVQGIVSLQAMVGKDGRILDLQLISGDPLLVPPSVEAVKQWVYRPTLLNGEPVEVITQIDVNYTLAK